MDGAPAGLCAPARIGEIMLVGMSKHKCGAGVACTQSSGCRASVLGVIGKDPSGCEARQEVVAKVAQCRSWPCGL